MPGSLNVALAEMNMRNCRQSLVGLTEHQDDEVQDIAYSILELIAL